LETKYPGKSSYSVPELNQAIDETLQNFKSKNDKAVHNLKGNLDQLKKDFASDKSAYEKLLEEVKNKASTNVKYFLFGLAVQFGVLFYLTYYSVGWDVTEPIAYLLTLSAEGVGIYMLLRYAKGYDQATVFDFAMQKYRK